MFCPVFARWSDELLVGVGLESASAADWNHPRSLIQSLQCKRPRLAIGCQNQGPEATPSPAIGSRQYGAASRIASAISRFRVDCARSVLMAHEASGERT